MLINGAVTAVAYNMPSALAPNSVYSDCGYSMTLQGSPESAIKEEISLI
jgi:hypothetical protein